MCDEEIQSGAGPEEEKAVEPEQQQPAEEPAEEPEEVTEPPKVPAVPIPIGFPVPPEEFERLKRAAERPDKEEVPEETAAETATSDQDDTAAETGENPPERSA